MTPGPKNKFQGKYLTCYPPGPQGGPLLPLQQGQEVLFPAEGGSSSKPICICDHKTEKRRAAWLRRVAVRSAHKQPFEHSVTGECSRCAPQRHLVWNFRKADGVPDLEPRRTRAQEFSSTSEDAKEGWCEWSPSIPVRCHPSTAKKIHLHFVPGVGQRLRSGWQGTVAQCQLQICLRLPEGPGPQNARPKKES